MLVKVQDVEANKGFDMTIEGVMPTDEAGSGGDSNGEIDYSLPFVADSVSLDLI